MAELTDQEKEDARKIFEGEVEGKSACYHCAGIHAAVAKVPIDRQPCPRIKKIDYAATGQVVSVEYWPWDHSWEGNVIFPQDVYDAE
jgi:hypothetical protein